MTDINNSKILITGGCGFIGSNFIKYLVQNFDNNTIVNVDKMGIGSRSLKNDIKDTIRGNNTYLEIEEDVRYIHRMYLNQHLEFDYIFHFAAESHVDRSISGPSKFIENNVMGTVGLLEWVRTKQQQAKIVEINTDECYGHLGKWEAPFDERSRFDPRSPYAASKAASAHICKAYANTYGLNILSTHCCNNFGPYQADEKFIPTIIRNMIQGTKIPVYGTGENIREWIHVDDHNKSLIEITLSGKSGKSYNIGSKIEKTNLEMIIDIGEILGITPDIEFVEDRKGHDFRYAVDSISYRRQFELRDHKEALKETIEHYKQKIETK